ncbi:hypothetical protein tloyanaT_30730 [Thalassotalea loyana]|uniref:DUF465 domain-containing protein n=1 Tax=Thalassotalea loyana TaxID=280483 RepID=A0ABQ6HFE0_9GAMM|nr:YdcH family protein [Thalassotalea loyana]GLX86820.1 hypothetical protein tloyanaT_30730 [Thalassotalea loyana]
MLGEDHSLVCDFPQFKETIDKLNQENELFASKAARYHQLDAEIRSLETANSPIGDNAIHQLKQERAQLKDMLYQMLLNA